MSGQLDKATVMRPKLDQSLNADVANKIIRNPPFRRAVQSDCIGDVNSARHDEELKRHALVL